MSLNSSERFSNSNESLEELDPLANHHVASMEMANLIFDFDDIWLYMFVIFALCYTLTVYFHVSFKDLNESFIKLKHVFI